MNKELHSPKSVRDYVVDESDKCAAGEQKVVQMLCAQELKPMIGRFLGIQCL